MIKSVTVTNYLNETIKMELKHPEKTGIIIRNIEGLGPGKADINIVDASTIDGGRYTSARQNTRNIVFDFAFMFLPDIETVRQKVYKYMPIKKMIKMVFETTNRVSQIYGYVEANEPDIFSQEESTQVSVICPDPHFYSLTPQITTFSGIENLFEFPFSNESLVENLLETGILLFNQTQTVLYEGDAEVGFVIYIHAIGSASGIAIYNIDTSEVLKLNSERLIELTGADISYGDDIIISTVRGEKYISLLRGGEYINILNCLERNSDWFYLKKGDNLLYYTAEIGETNLQFRVENRIVYEGV